MEPTRIKGNAYKGSEIATVKMLQTRELCGNVAPSAKGKCNFKDEYTKRLVSQPLIWEYKVRENTISRSLEQVEIIAQIANEEYRTDLIISGDIGGHLRFHVVDKDRAQLSPCRVRCKPEYVWPLDIENKDEFAKSPGELWTVCRMNSLGQGNAIGCLKKMGKQGGEHKILITAAGSVYLLGLADPIVFDARYPSSIWNNLLRIAEFNVKILDVDCNLNATKVLLGTKNGAALMDLETGQGSWVCSCERDIEAVQLDNSEKIGLCGLQNGAIVSVDTRQRPERHASFTPTSTPLSSPHSHERVIRQRLIFRSGETEKGWFEVRGAIYPSRTLLTPSSASSVTCLTSLKLYDEYFLASSENGKMKLYDHRMVKRGAVLSYKGNIGVHGTMKHAVDPSEKFVISGGTDGEVRLWNIKSGELLFKERFMDCIPSEFCWGMKEDNGARVGSIYNQHSIFGEAWIGGLDGIYHMRW